MESNLDKINNLPIVEVIAWLWYYENSHYIIKSWMIRMFDQKWQVSDWWIWDIKKNKFFARWWDKWYRFKWDVVSIIKTALDCDANQAMSWAEEKFSIDRNTSKPSKSMEMKKRWDELWWINASQKTYLKSRNIDSDALEKAGVIKRHRCYMTFCSYTPSW